MLTLRHRGNAAIRDASTRNYLAPWRGLVMSRRPTSPLPLRSRPVGSRARARPAPPRTAACGHGAINQQPLRNRRRPARPVDARVRRREVGLRIRLALTALPLLAGDPVLADTPRPVGLVLADMPKTVGEVLADTFKIVGLVIAVAYFEAVGAAGPAALPITQQHG